MSLRLSSVVSVPPIGYDGISLAHPKLEMDREPTKNVNPCGAPGYILSILSAPLMAHFADIMTLSSRSGSSVPQLNSAGGSWVTRNISKEHIGTQTSNAHHHTFNLFKFMKKGEIIGSLLPSSVFPGR